MAKRGGIGATYQRENKKKKYTRKLSKKTKDEIKSRSWSFSSDKKANVSESRLNQSLGGRAGTKTENKDWDNAKKAIKSIAMSYYKKQREQSNADKMTQSPSKMSANLEFKSYSKPSTPSSLKTKEEKGLYEKYKQSGRNNQFQVGNTLKAINSGVYSNKTSDKAKENVAKAIESEYNKKAKTSGDSFVAGLTKSDVNVKTRTKALTGKEIDLSKVTKKKGYKAGDVTQEVASYFIAPTEAASAKIGSAIIKSGAKKALKKEMVNAGAKVSKKAVAEGLSTKAVSKAIKEASETGIRKATTKAAKIEADKIKDKAVRKAVTDSIEKTVGSRAKRQLARRGGDVVANAPLNAYHATSHVKAANEEKLNSELKSIDKRVKKGELSADAAKKMRKDAKERYSKINFGDVAKDFAINTGLDIGVGGGIDAIAGKVRKVKAGNAERIKKYQDEIKTSTTTKETVAKKKKDTSGFKPLYTAKKGQPSSGAKTLREGKKIKELYDAIDEAVKAGKMSKVQARKEKKALVKALQNETGRTGFAYRTRNGIEYGNATKHGIEKLDAEKYGNALLNRKKFTGKKMNDLREDAMARQEVASQRQALREQEAADRAIEESGIAPIGKDTDLRERERLLDKEANERYGKTWKSRVEDEVNRVKSKPKSKAAEKRQQKAVTSVHKKYALDEETSNAVDRAIKNYINSGDKEALRKAVKDNVHKVAIERTPLDENTTSAIRAAREALKKGFYRGRKGSQLGDATFGTKEEFSEFGTRFFGNNGKIKRNRPDEIYDELRELYGNGLFPEHITNEQDILERIKQVADMNDSDVIRTAGDYNMSKNDIDELTDNIVNEYVEAAAKAEPKGAKNFKAPERPKSVEAETDVVDDIATSNNVTPHSTSIKEENFTPVEGTKSVSGDGERSLSSNANIADEGVKVNAETEELRKLQEGDQTHNGTLNDQRSLKERQADNKAEIESRYERGEIDKAERDRLLKENRKIKNVDDTIATDQDALMTAVRSDDVKNNPAVQERKKQLLANKEREEELAAKRLEEYMSESKVAERENRFMELQDDFNAKKDTAGELESSVTAKKTDETGNVSTNNKNDLKTPRMDSDIAASKETLKHFATPEKLSGKGKINEWVTEAKRKFVDSLYFIESDAKKYAKITGDNSYADAMRGELNNLRQAKQQADYSFENEQLDFNMRPVGESAKDMLQDMNRKGTYADTTSYLYLMNHAERLEAAGAKKMDELIRESRKIKNDLEAGHISSSEAQMKLDRVEEQMDILENEGITGISGEKNNKRIFDDLTADEARAKAKEIAEKNPEVLNDAKRVVQYFRNDLRSQVQSGLVDELTAIHYMETYPHYVPAHRADFTTGLSAKTTINPDPKALRAKGSGRDVQPLEYQMQASANYTFTQGANNKVKQLIAEKSGMEKNVLDLIEKEQGEINPMDIATFYDKKNATIKFYDNGKLKTIDLSNVDGGHEIVKDLIDQATNNTNSELTNAVLNGLGKVNRGFKALITSYSLPFMVKNFFRDVPEGALQSESTRGYLKNLISADNSLRSILNNDDYYRAYVRAGGAHGQFIDPIKLFDEKKFSKLNPINKIERLNEITEQIPRVAEFKNALQRMGVTPQTATANQLRQASQAAADVTVNFGRGGSWGRMINKSFVPFFNPAIQGADKLIRVVARDKNAGALMKLMSKAALLGVAPAAVNEMLLADDKYYKNIQERDRMINYYIPLDKDNPLSKLFGSDKVGAENGEVFLKIPKARALSVFGAIEQKATGKLDDTGWLDIVGVAKDQVGPVGVSNNIFQQFINAKNNKTWYGTDIETQGDMKNADGTKKLPHNRYDANTSNISIGLAKALSKMGVEASPKKIDYLLDSYTGIIGDVALGRTKKAATRGLLAKSFSTDSVLQSNVQTRYYSKLNDTTDKNELDKLNSWSGRIRTVNSAIKAVQDSDDKDKAVKVRELTKVRNSLMKKALDGKTSKNDVKDIEAISRQIGVKKTVDMFVKSKADKEVLKKYGKADDNFLKGYLAIRDVKNKTGSTNKTSKALALASSGANEKLAKAYGLTDKGARELKSSYKRAKEFLKNGGTVEEYTALNKAVKGQKVKGNNYAGIASVLASVGAEKRAYALFDLKADKVQRGINMAALGIKPNDLAKHKTKADADGNGYIKKNEALSYLSGAKLSKAEKSVIYESMYYWGKNKNPYGHVNASAKDAVNKKLKEKYATKAKAGDGPANWVVPHKKGYEIDPITKKRKPIGKTVGGVGDKVALPAGRTASELARDEKAGKIKRTIIEERLHNAFGSRIGDIKKKKVFKATTIKDVTKHKDGTVDITFANGEVWRNPANKPKDLTKIESPDSGRGRGRGRRGWGRRGRRGRGGGRGGSGTYKRFGGEQNHNFNLKGYVRPSGKAEITVRPEKDNHKVGLSQSQLKALMKRSVSSQGENAKTTKRKTGKDVYKITATRK